MSKKIKNLQEISGKYKNYFFDLDGVFWKGQKQIPHSFNRLKELDQNQNNRLFYITNSSVRNRDQVKKKFQGFGFSPKIEDIYSSSYVAGLYLKDKYPQYNKVICVGSQSMTNQLKKTGLDVMRLQYNSQQIQLKEVSQTIDLSRQAIIMGYDKYINYNKICLISLYLQKGLKFLGTNPDKYTMIDGYRMPGTGCLIKCVEQASNIKAQIIGKPNPFLINYIIQKEKLNREQCIMIGDNLQTDIIFGQRGKIDTLVVLTGVANEKDLNGEIIPTYYCECL